ncbi:MAG: radical SAM protein [Candidatus Margulisbacteria bacterium]|nr:radical SAM protein [Candidatus Margulisiibacteriota bacterium]
MEKYLFINPEARVNQAIPNLGLAYAATSLGVKVIDLNTLSSPPDRYLKVEAETLGISVQSRTLSEAKKIARKYKEKFPHATIKSVSGFLDVLCCYPYMDFDNRIHFAEPFSDEYPFPNYELFDSFPKFQKNWKSGKWQYVVMTSQGCPYQCIYCSSRNRKWLSRSAENSIEELRRAKERWGIKSFNIIDDCFNINKQRLLKFCELVKPLNLSWACANGLRADLFDEEIARAITEAGCKHISFGVESSDPDVLKQIKKGETIEHLETAIKTAKRYAQSVSGFFIIGLPGSSYEKDLFSLRWAERLGIIAHFSYYVPSDKVLEADQIFYGRDAEPVSDIYPKNMQKKVYRMTAGMRPGFSWRKLARKVKGLFK